MSPAFDERLRKLIINEGKKSNMKLHEKGTYVCIEGPRFSTKAESLMHRSMGGDVIGMTGVPEV